MKERKRTYTQIEISPGVLCYHPKLVVDTDESGAWVIFIMNSSGEHSLARILPSQYKKLERVIGKIRGKK